MTRRLFRSDDCGTDRISQARKRTQCDYKRELINQESIRQLVHADPFLTENRFVVPTAMTEWSTAQVLTSEYRPGGTIDKVSVLDQDERNRIGRATFGLLSLRPAVRLTDERQVLILGSMGSGTQQVSEALRKLLKVEISHEFSNAESYFARDGTVSSV
jgi:hypothetical protein